MSSTPACASTGENRAGAAGGAGGGGEGVDPSYLCRALRLTLLAPDIVEAILDDRLPSEIGVAEIMRPLPAEWGEQRGRLKYCL